MTVICVHHMFQCSMCLLVSHLPSRSIVHELQNKPKHTVHIQHVYHQGPVLSFDFLQNCNNNCFGYTSTA